MKCEASHCKDWIKQTMESKINQENYTRTLLDYVYTDSTSRRDIMESSSRCDDSDHNNKLTQQQKSAATMPDRASKEKVTRSALDEGQSTDDLADAFSSSLAHLVAIKKHGQNAGTRENNHHQRIHKVVARSARSSSEEGPSSSSSGSNHDGGVVVTANTTTSSGDDPESSSRNTGTTEGSGSNSNRNNNSSSGGEGRLNEARLQRHNAQRHIEGKSEHVLLSHCHHHHHHDHNQQRRRDADHGPASDGFGLPVPNDYVLRREQRVSSEHAAVVAHLPPPSTDGASSSSGSGGEADRIELLQRHHEPRFHTIRRTFNQFQRSRKNTHNHKSSETDSSAEQQIHRRMKSSKRPHADVGDDSSKPPPSVKRQKPELKTKESDELGSDDNGGSSGSGTEGGYEGSASSNDRPQGHGSCSSPSVSSSEVSFAKRKHIKGNGVTSGGRHRPMLSIKQESTFSLSSEIADFSSSISESAIESYSLQVCPDSSSSDSNSITSSSNSGSDGSSDEQAEEPVVAKRRSGHSMTFEMGKQVKWPPIPRHIAPRVPFRGRRRGCDKADSKLPAVRRLKSPPKSTKSPIMSVGCDIMAHILTFLEPTDILDVLTAPLSREWLVTFTRQPELWRVLCLLEPFKARVDDDDDSSDEESAPFYPFDIEKQLRGTFGKYRLMYTSFVRCMRYLARIKDDALHGRAPSVTGESEAVAKLSSLHNIGANSNLQDFLARARSIVGNGVAAVPAAGSDISDDDEGNGVARIVAHGQPIGISDDGSSTVTPPKRKKKIDDSNSKRKKIKFAHSKLTERLLGPTNTGEAGDVNLPWSCAIYSVVNWMVAFSDVEGMQTMCLKVLPLILENEQQRVTAQRAGLTDLVLRAMVFFPESAPLHTAAFHTIVLLARPLGGQEGMLFHTSMVNASGIFDRGDDGPKAGNNGIAVMLDSMKRFSSNEVLQAMSCWSLVNIALVSNQKEVLVKLGGIETTANAMMQHPYNAEVQVRYYSVIICMFFIVETFPNVFCFLQFRGLFALINLVIPSVRLNAEEQGNNETIPDPDTSEKEMLDEMVDQVVHLVVLAMKNFCSSEAILNRACLVLHNLSLTPGYHEALLWTPNCYQMLDWCLANYRTDQVLQQSAAGTLHRLQMTLSSDETLRARFASSLQAQQQLSLEQAHREAVHLREQQEQVARQYDEAP